jgi:hypothetical protein
MTKVSQAGPAFRSTVDQRKFIRLNNVFPVEFSVVCSPEDLLDMFWQQGYTCNVSRGGICLETVFSDEETVRRLQGGKAYFELRIRIPLSYPPVTARAEAVWLEKDDNGIPGKCRIGLKFISADPVELGRMVGHARRLKYAASAGAGVLIFLFLALAASGWYNLKLRLANETLVNDLVAAQQQEGNAGEAMEEIIEEGALILREVEKYTGDEAGRRKLENIYAGLAERGDRVSDQLNVLTRKKGGLRKTVVEKMRLWLQSHQHVSTGLVLSFEGDVGIIKDWAFIYDQALAAHVFLSSGDGGRARKILNFFNQRAKGDFQGFHNGYYYDSGEVAESTVHCGPNIWVAIAALQYIHKTGDKYYLPLARKVTDWLITIQDRDPAGGLKGGPEFSWFATEHNLDAYALFNMMHEMTGEDKYRAAKEKVLSWLKTYAMVPHSVNYKSPPVNRGRGDATVATDTYAWSLAALGPEKLEAMGMDPEEIMKFAEEHCAVEVKFERPSGAVLDVRGFDFAKYAHMPRGGLVSPEWTSQMIVSFRILSRYFARKEDVYKAKYYEGKAEMYLNELNKLIISSPSARGQGEGCLPYATLPDADTGHGWNTPSGTRTCSIAGTAYMIMAVNQWNPLMLEKENDETLLEGPRL